LVPGGGYWACLLVLAIPAFNHLRNDIIREFGLWFFCTLAFSLALRWQERGGWLRALLVQLAIVAAALFRLEAVLLFPVLGLCLVGELQTREGWRRLLQINLFPLAGIVAALLWLLSGHALAQARVDYVVSLLDPRSFLAGFNADGQQFAKVALQKYSADEARQVVFFGLLFTLLSKFVALCGPFALPLLYRPGWRGVAEYLATGSGRWPGPGSCISASVADFLRIQERFINSRYVSFLNLLAVPLLTIVLLCFARNFPRLARIFVVMALLVMLQNVVSFSAKKTHYLEAGAWLSQHTSPADAIFYEDSRFAYYAGRGYPYMPVTREQAMSAEQAQNFRYFVLIDKAGRRRAATLDGAAAQAGADSVRESQGRHRPGDWRLMPSDPAKWA
jgi:4-amino-4-deoxy-L-arabinose transferase-like glycosyltransferase